MARCAPTRHALGDGYLFCRVINGGWQLSPGHSENAWSENEILDGWSRRVESGLTTFDVADIYTGVEQIVGRLVRRFEPGAVQVHTKCVPNRSRLAALRAADIEVMVDGSLRRLGVERLDLVQFHWWDFAIDGWIDALQALERQREAGKIRFLGVTNFDAHRLGALLDAGLPIRVNQVQYSVVDRRPACDLADLCDKRGVCLLAYGALAGGFLTRAWQGQARPDTDTLNRSLRKYLLIADECGGWDALQQRLVVLDGIARKHEAEISEIALRWVLERAGVAAAIVGAVGDKHLDSVRRVFDFQLDADDHRALERDAPKGLQGKVYGLERESARHARLMRDDLNP